jgi:chaperone BCS1
MDLASITHAILQNQVVTGLSFTALLGGAVYQLRSIPHLIKRGVLRFMTVELTVISSDSAFEWVDRWLATQPYAKKSKMMRLQANNAAQSPVYDRDPAVSPEWTLSPGPGTHLFWWHGRPVVLERSYLSKDAVDNNARMSKPIEQLHFRTIGQSQETIRTLISEAQSLNKDELVSVRFWAEYRWERVRGRSPRGLDTIVLKHGQAQRLLDDLQWFAESRNWYLTRGIPYRRGYCFSGPPGTGKTSVVLALAGLMNRPICVLNLGSIESDEALFSAFYEAPLNAIILIEDIDCAFPAQTRDVKPDGESADDGRGVSKAGLLNVLDGITTPDGRIFIMTTNYPERLDAALVRPGRADVHETFEYFEAPEQLRMAARFYHGLVFEPVSHALSPAEMQAAFMQFPHDPKAAHDYLESKTDHFVARVA